MGCCLCYFFSFCCILSSPFLIAFLHNKVDIYVKRFIWIHAVNMDFLRFLWWWFLVGWKVNIRYIKCLGRRILKQVWIFSSLTLYGYESWSCWHSVFVFICLFIYVCEFISVIDILWLRMFSKLQQSLFGLFLDSTVWYNVIIVLICYPTFAAELIAPSSISDSPVNLSEKDMVCSFALIDSDVALLSFANSFILQYPCHGLLNVA